MGVHAAVSVLLVLIDDAGFGNPSTFGGTTEIMKEIIGRGLGL
jgi:hypothetical protein